MFTDPEITAALAALNPANDQVNGALTARKVMRRPGAYSDLEAKLVAARGFDAVQLQAALVRLQSPQANAGDVGKFGGKSGIQFRKSDNRNAILETALAVVYPPLLDNTTGRNNATGQMVNPAEDAYAARREGTD
jgi:hypothetical protein